MTMTCDLLGAVSDDPVKIIRPPEHASAKYSNLTNKYREKNADYNNQYCKIYTVRLEQMLPLLTERVKIKWGLKYPIIKLHKLQENSKTKCVIIGTLFKDQKLKPTLLKKISEANSLVPQPIYTHFTDDSDTLFIEDDLQRYQLIGNIDIHKLVTGVTCAFLGTDQGMGKFMIEDFCFADCRPQIERCFTTKEDRFICFISGIDLSNYENNIMPLKLFIDWIVGFLGDEEVQNENNKISRLIIAGNSVRTKAEAKKHSSLVAKVVESSETLNAVKQLDIILNQFVKFLSVDLMPGQYDPSNHLLSQQPMHHCMFPNAAKYKTKFNCVTNPYECEVEGLKILGSAGQPVTDITGYSRIESSLEALEQCIIWNHLAPTCPDTLGSYPYYNRDPFVIEECPHVVFAGNQPKFETKLHEGPEGQTVRLICVPTFSKTFSVALLNLKNLDCHEISFEVEDLD